MRERINALLFSRMRVAYWRAQGLSIGANTILPRVSMSWPHQVRLGANCTVENDVYFKFDGIYQIGPSIVVSDDCFIGRYCEFNIRVKLSIGKNCLIASNCYFVDHDHGYSSRELPMRVQHSTREKGIELSEDVWIGAGVTVLKGVTIGRGSIVAAGSVVNKSIPSYEVWGGVPAKKIGVRP